MQKRKKLICILLGALMLMGALSGCAPEATPEGERFVLRVSVSGRIPSLDPAMNTDEKAQSAFCALYENLMRMADDGTGRAAAAPGVAKEYKAVENFDGTVDYAFTLRASARWSDGARVRARDFVYAWRRLVDPETDSPNHALLSMISGYDTVRETGDITALAVRAENDTTFRVTLSAPCAYFLTEVCTAVATMPVRGDLIRDDPDWAERAAVVGNGAYRVGVWAKNEYLQLRRSSSYHDSRAAAPDTLRFVFSGGGAEAWRLYESGRVDYAASPPGAAAASAAVPLRATACLLYNHMSDVFSNEHARRAFDLALDRAALAAAAGASAAPATGYVPYGVAGGVESEISDFRAAGGEPCAVDEAGYAARCLEAERELRLAGYREGKGFPDVTYLYVADGANAAVAAAAAAMWSEHLSVSVATEGVSREEFDQRVAEGAYDLAADTIRTPYGDAMSYLGRFSGTDGNNLLHYASTPYDLLIGVAASTHDEAARAAFLHDAEALLLGDAALSPLYFDGVSYLLREGLDGVYHDALGNPYFFAVTKG